MSIAPFFPVKEIKEEFPNLTFNDVKYLLKSGKINAYVETLPSRRSPNGGCLYDKEAKEAAEIFGAFSVAEHHDFEPEYYRIVAADWCQSEVKCTKIEAVDTSKKTREGYWPFAWENIFVCREEVQLFAGEENKRQSSEIISAEKAEKDWKADPKKLFNLSITNALKVQVIQ